MAGQQIIAHTVAIQSPGSVPYRVVLVEHFYDGQPYEYVVWFENLKEEPPHGHSGFHSGKYFTVQYGQAEETFKQAYEVYKTRAYNFEQEMKVSGWKLVRPEATCDYKADYIATLEELYRKLEKEFENRINDSVFKKAWGEFEKDEIHDDAMRLRVMKEVICNLKK
jgi:hypothetical protein